MRYPSIRGNNGYRVNIPQLNGGVNTMEAPNAILDNQLTESTNLWWRNGSLQTRPGLALPDSFFSYITRYKDESELGVRCNFCNAFIHGQPCKVIIFYDDTGVNLLIVSAKGTALKYVYVCNTDEESAQYPCLPYTGKATRGIGLYILVPKVTQTGKSGRIFEVTESLDVVSIPQSDLYVPLVYVNGKGNQYSELPAETTTENAGASMFEGFNMLTGAFRASYLLDDRSYQFKLPVTNLTDEEIVIEALQSDGTFMDRYVIPAGETESAPIKQGSSFAYARVDRQLGLVETLRWNVPLEQEEGNPLPSTMPRNGLVITASKTSPDALDRIFGMAFAEQFGGAEGINGGSRTFVSGNAKYPNLVHWTDVNRPLYFPENNYAYVGEGNQAVTAFGKQADMLVIFKEHEIYYTTYVQGAAYTAEDLLAGRVIDVTAVSATFPIIQCHGSIGCNCRDTVQLCANRLIWATTDHKVYTLVTRSNSSERNVQELSAPIEKIWQPFNMQYAFSLDWQGHYLLFCDNHAFLLDYSKSAYQYISSSYDTSKSQKSLVWHHWDFTYKESGTPAANSILYSGFASGDSCVLFFMGHPPENNGKIQNVTLIYHLEDCVEDTFGDLIMKAGYPYIVRKNQAIASSFTTKVYDFGTPDRKKDFKQIYLGVDNHSEAELRVAFLTDCGQTDCVPIRITRPAYDSQFGLVLRILPAINRVYCLGMQCESESRIAVNSLILKYKLLGSVQ